MEGVPRMPMLSIEMKLSMNSPEFGSKIRQYIAKHYQEDPDLFNDAVRDLEALRENALRGSADVTGCNLQKKYFAQLHLLKSRFPMEPNEECAVTFSWLDKFYDMPNTMSYDDINFELSCVLHNVGALHSSLGAQDSRISSEGMKIACTHFQCAAWCFMHLRDEMTAEKYTADFDRNMLTWYINLMLAQAQECILEKSLIDNRKNLITAKVSAQVAEFYRQCVKSLSQGSVEDIVGGTRAKYWTKFCSLKAAYYDAMALYHMALQAESDQQWGTRLAYCDAANNKFQEAQKLGKNEAEQIKQALQFAQDVIAGKHNVAKRENDFIYHEKIPDLFTLPEIKGASLVKPIAFDHLSPDISGPDFFARLVPLSVHQAASMYSEEKAKLLREVNTRIGRRNEDLSAYIASLQLDQSWLSADSTQDLLPQSLIERCAAMNAQPTFVSELHRRLEELGVLHKEVEASLSVVQTSLTELEKDCQMLENAALKADTLNTLSEIGENLKRFSEADSQASRSNAELLRIFEAQAANLQKLARPLLDLQKILPPLPVEGAATPEGTELKRLLAKVDEMRLQRQDLLEQLRSQMHADDVTKQLLANQDRTPDVLFAKELKKHDKLIGLLDQNMSAQENVLKALTDANAAYAVVRKGLMQALQSREQTIAALVNAFDTMKDVDGKAIRGQEFYERLQQAVRDTERRLEVTRNNIRQYRDDAVAELEKKAAKARALAEAQMLKPAPTPQEIDPLMPQLANGTGSGLPTTSKSAASTGPRLKDYLEYYRAKKEGRTVLPPGVPLPTDNYMPVQPTLTQIPAQPPPIAATGYYLPDLVYPAASQWVPQRVSHDVAPSEPASASTSLGASVEQNAFVNDKRLPGLQPVFGYVGAHVARDAGETFAPQTFVSYAPSINTGVTTGTGTQSMPSLIGSSAQSQSAFAAAQHLNMYSTGPQHLAAQMQPQNLANQAAYGVQHLHNDHVFGQGGQLPISSQSVLTPSAQISSSVSQLHGQPQQGQNYAPSTVAAPFHAQGSIGSTMPQGTSAAPVFRHPSVAPTMPNQVVSHSMQMPTQSQQVQRFPAHMSNIASYEGYSSESARVQQQPASVPQAMQFNQVQPLPQQQSGSPAVFSASGVASSAQSPVHYVTPTRQQFAQETTSYALPQGLIVSSASGPPQSSLPHAHPTVLHSQQNFGHDASSLTGQDPSSNITPERSGEQQHLNQPAYAPATTNINSFQQSVSLQQFTSQTSTLAPAVASAGSSVLHFQQPVPNHITAGAKPLSFVEQASRAMAQLSQYSTPNFLLSQSQLQQPGSVAPNQPPMQQQPGSVAPNQPPMQQQPGSVAQNQPPILQQSVIASSSAGTIFPGPQQPLSYSIPYTPQPPQGHTLPSASTVPNQPAFAGMDTPLAQSALPPPLQPASKQPEKKPDAKPSCSAPVAPSVSLNPDLASLDVNLSQAQPSLARVIEPIVPPESSKQGVANVRPATIASERDRAAFGNGADPFNDDATLQRFAADVEKFDKFVHGLPRRSLSGPTGLEKVWKELGDKQEVESRKHKISVARCCATKNRLSDVMPYDDTRVVLKASQDDYINASYVTQLNEWTPNFIITQAPLPNSMADFWLMIFEQQVEIVVALIADSECKPYWPVDKQDKLRFGKLVVSLESVRSVEESLERTITITQDETRAVRSIIHLQVQSWPSNPADHQRRMLQFVTETHYYYKQQRGAQRPVCVHCTVGIERSAVFCVLWAAMHEILHKAAVPNIVQLVDRLRQCRKNCVADQKDLLFVYEAVAMYAENQLRKRGVLTHKSSFSDPPSKTHSRHSSQDLQLSPALVRNAVQAAATENGSARQIGSSRSSIASTASTSPAPMVEPIVENVPIKPVLQPQAVPNIVPDSPKTTDLSHLTDPDKFQLDANAPRKRTTKADFYNKNSNTGLEKPKIDAMDPFSGIDPMWSLKKN